MRILGYRVAAIVPVFCVMCLLIASCTGSRRLNALSAPDVSGIASALTYKEFDERGYIVNVPVGWQNPVIDYKSRIEIDIAQSELERLIATEPSLSPLAPEERDRMSKLLRISAALGDYIAVKKSNMRTMEVYFSTDVTKRRDDLRKKVQEAIQGEARILAPLMRALEEQIVARAVREGVPNAPKSQRVREMKDALVECNGAPCLLNVDMVAQLINEETKYLQGLVDQDLSVLDRLKHMNIEIRAFLYGKRTSPLRVHVENYDSLDAGNVVKRERIIHSLDESDRERLMTEYLTAASLANTINSAGSLTVKVKGALKKYLDGESATVTGAAIEELGQLKEFVAGIDWSASEELTMAKGRLDVLKADMDAFAALLDNAKLFIAASNITDTLDAYSKLASSWSQCKSVLVAFPQHVSDAVDALKKQEVMATLATVNVTAETIEGLKEKLEALTQGRVNEMELAMDTVLGVKNAVDIAARLDEIKKDHAGVILHAASDTPRGVIDLARTVADRDDHLAVDVTLTNAPGSGSFFRDETSRTFTIERTGWTSDFNASLIFVDRIGSGNEGDPEVSYKAAPSVSWGLHYRLRPQTPSNGQTALLWTMWRLLDPGFALSAASLDFENESMQIGIGGQVSLMNELLILGYGYNLHAATDRDYWYVGIGLLGPLSELTSRALTK